MTASTISNQWGVAATYRYFHKSSLNESVNQLISDEAVYRTAPATPGLVKTQYMLTKFSTSKYFLNITSFRLCLINPLQKYIHLLGGHQESE